MLQCKDPLYVWKYINAFKGFSFILIANYSYTFKEVDTMLNKYSRGKTLSLSLSADPSSYLYCCCWGFSENDQVQGHD